MYKLILTLLCTTVAFTGLARAQDNAERIASQIRTSVVAITVSILLRPDPTNAPVIASTAADRLPTKAIYSGTGLLVSADGLILTIASVLEQPGEITVAFEGGSTAKAEIVGKDRRSNIAVLRVGSAIPAFITLKSASPPALGERLLSVGRRVFDGLNFPVVSDGLASAFAPLSPATATYIHSSAPLYIDMGGGPLVSQKTGNVVGINMPVDSRGGVLAPAYTAVPINEAIKIMDQLISKGRVVRSTIGISSDLRTITDEMRTALGIPGRDGVLISRVSEAGPAARAGLRIGDIVLSADGVPVRTFGALVEVIGAQPPGETIQLVVFRNRSTITIGVTREEFQ
jgi:serine protease Do